jgi:hypothetical protein
MEMFDFVKDHSVELLSVLAALNVVAGLVARMTKTLADDHVVAVVGRVLGWAGSLGAKPMSVKPSKLLESQPKK